MTHKSLIRRLQISCLGLDHVDPLRLLVDDVIEALRENAMREVQRLGQEIEQEPVGINGLTKAEEDATASVRGLINTTPPKRKPLTIEQIEDAWRKVEAGDFYDCVQPFARAIEAAHGIKENK